MAGLMFAGVVVLATVAARRAQARLRSRSRADRPIIDGVREPAEAELDARPQREANAAPERLESEASDVVGDAERW